MTPCPRRALARLEPGDVTVKATWAGHAAEAVVAVRDDERGRQTLVLESVRGN